MRTKTKAVMFECRSSGKRLPLTSDQAMRLLTGCTRNELPRVMEQAEVLADGRIRFKPAVFLAWFERVLGQTPSRTTGKHASVFGRLLGTNQHDVSPMLAEHGESIGGFLHLDVVGAIRWIWQELRSGKLPCDSQRLRDIQNAEPTRFTNPNAGIDTPKPRKSQAPKQAPPEDEPYSDEEAMVGGSL